MGNLTQTYTTKMETAEPQEIGAILDAKLEATSSQGVADYIGLANDNILSAIERLKKAENELKAIRVEAERQLDIINEGAAEWLQDSGVDKLSGDRVSSVSVLDREFKEDLIVTDEEHLINAGYFKTVLDKTAIKNAIKDGAEVEGACIEITHLPAKARVNRRKAK